MCVSALFCESGFMSVDLLPCAFICVALREDQSTVERRNRPELPGRGERRTSLPAANLCSLSPLATPPQKRLSEPKPSLDGCLLGRRWRQAKLDRNWRRGWRAAEIRP